MRSIVAIVLLLFFCLPGCSNSEGIPENDIKLPVGFHAVLKKSFDFDQVAVGLLPEGWTNRFTGRGAPGQWQVVLDDGNRVLAQLSQKYGGYHFNLAVYEGISLKDLEIMLDFKAVKGKEDRGGGPVWRYKDANNYYVARANPLEDNFRVYRVVNGDRQQLASAQVDVPSGKWHKMKIRMIGDHIECFLNGRKFLDVIDSTFDQGGRIGVWTKADAVTYFDNIEVKAISIKK